jgi:FkbM family methyltransferase
MDTKADRDLNAYDQLLKRGSVAFDIGAYVGGRVDMLLDAGCKLVVAVEPVLEYANRLREKYWNMSSSVIVLHNAAGPYAGTSSIRVHKAFWPDGVPMDSTLSSMSEEWIAMERPDWKPADWSERQTVEVITLDWLISRYGNPDFIKIDVEGYEQEVIKGLTQPVKMLSFEFHSSHLDWAEQVVDHLLGLGSYEFNHDTGDNVQLAYPTWLSKNALFNDLRGRDIYGDIFARLTISDIQSIGGL